MAKPFNPWQIIIKKSNTDGRRETDDYGKKIQGTHKDGSTWKRYEWFGYKVHLIVDVTMSFGLHILLRKRSRCVRRMK